VFGHTSLINIIIKQSGGNTEFLPKVMDVAKDTERNTICTLTEWLNSSQRQIEC